MTLNPSQSRQSSPGSSIYAEHLSSKSRTNFRMAAFSMQFSTESTVEAINGRRTRMRAGRNPSRSHQRSLQDRRELITVPVVHPAVEMPPLAEIGYRLP